MCVDGLQGIESIFDIMEMEEDDRNNLLQVRVLAPHRLRYHLRQLHGCQCGREPPVAAQHVDARLDQTHRLAEHVLRVALQLCGQLHSRQVRLH